MSRLIVGFVGALTLAGCAVRRSPYASADPQTQADLQTAYACAQNTLTAFGYRVAKDDRELKIRGWIREDMIAATTGPVASAAASDVGLPPTLYEIDGVDAAISLDKKGQVQAAANAYTGAGGSARGGYVVRAASGRGASVAKKIESCASALVLPPVR